MSSTPLASAVGSQVGDVHMAMLRSIFDQNSQILAQNCDLNARLTAVEKEVEKVSQRGLVRSRPRSKCADGLPWRCPVCLQPQKHLDSFLSHVRKLAIRTCHRAGSERVHQAKCSINLQVKHHLDLAGKFPGANDAEKAASFAAHFLKVCRTISASGTALADKHARIFEWLHTVTHDPKFEIVGECPTVSDSPSSCPGAVAGGNSSSSDVAAQQRIRL